MIKQFEGLRLRAYQCAAGVWTIGYGHTRGVRMGDRITAQQADRLLSQDVAEMMRQVGRLHVARTIAQQEALTSLAFNIGIARVASSTLLKRIREGASRAVITREWMRWVYAGGKRLPGLVSRRAWEADHFFAPSYPTDDEIIDRV